MVLIKMFQNENVGLGILGIFCGLWAFIWGWMKAKEHGLQKIMKIWTVAFVAVLVGYGLMIAGGLNEMKKLEDSHNSSLPVEPAR